MKNRVIGVLLLIVLLSGSFTGCKLATEEGKVENLKGDKLVGGYVTAESIEGKVYAVKEMNDDVVKYVFKDVKGAGLILPELDDKESLGVFDDGINNRVTGFHDKDGDTRDMTLSGTVYCTKEDLYFLNPVYQEADGDVYMIQDGMGIFMSAGSCSQSIKEEYTETGDGKKEKQSMEIKVTYEYILGPDSIKLVYIGADNCEVKVEEYKPGEVPEKIVADSNVEYIVIESYSREGVKREVVSRGDEGVSTYCENDYNLCVEMSSDIEWE